MLSLRIVTGCIRYLIKMLEFFIETIDTIKWITNILIISK